MGDSLQDQLRALGLATAKADAGRKKKRPVRKSGRQGDPAGSPKQERELSLDEAYALRERDEKRQAERAKLRRQEDERRKRRINRCIREIVTARRQNRGDAQFARNFLYNGRIRKIHVTEEQLRALNAGEIGIVYLSGGYHLLEPDALEAVRRISPEHVVDLAGEAAAEDSGYPVPDDLIW